MGELHIHQLAQLFDVVLNIKWKKEAFHILSAINLLDETSNNNLLGFFQIF